MKYRLIEDCRNEFPVRYICAALDVSPSGYYAWKSRSPSPRAEENRRLLDDIRRLHERHRHRYGVPRMLVELRKEGWTVSRGRVSRLMRRHGLSARHRKAFRVCTTDSNHSLPVAPNLLDQNFAAEAPNRIWLADIPDIQTDEGWLYLAVVLDLFTRKVVGWAMRDHMRTELVLAALTMAIQRQRPQPGLIQHSDRGSQYASFDYRKALESNKMIASMSRKGNCWEPAGPAQLQRPHGELFRISESRTGP